MSLTVKEAIEKVPDIRRLYEGDERHQQLLDFAIALEGLSRHAGIHAAGIVIAPGPLDNYVPICTQDSKGSGSGSDERVVVTQFDMNALEKAGMLKMDFLGLTTLTIIHDALETIKARGRDVPNLDTLPFDDEATFRAFLARAAPPGVFQFWSRRSRRTSCARCAPDSLRRPRRATNALIRPGPLDAGMHKVYIRRKRGDEAVSYALPELEEILKSTYGVITYQEQVMRIAQRLAGISLAEADVLRKAVGKKDAELIRTEIGKFADKAIARGHDKKIISDLSDQIETFGRYGFNKSHAVAYTVLSYHTAYLKTHYPAEFMAALLSACIGDTDAVVKYINEARDLGIEILPPDVNESGYKFTVLDDKRIRFGQARRGAEQAGRGAPLIRLSARGAEKGMEDRRCKMEEAMEDRRSKIPSIFHLPSSIVFPPSTILPKESTSASATNVFEALLYAGAFDGPCGHRAQLAAATGRRPIQHASLLQDEASTGQGSFLRRRRPRGRGRCHAALAAEHRADDGARAPHEGKRDDRLLHLGTSARTVPRRV